MKLIVAPSVIAFYTSLFLLGEVEPARAGDFLFQWDNDKVADTDRHYTNGMRIAYTPDEPTAELQGVGVWLADKTIFAATPSPRVGWTFGQDMYTPEDVEASVPDPTDRPYAGWTYFGIYAQSETSPGWEGLDQQDTVELNLGIVGPESRAAETQTWFHGLINVPKSYGWDHQIGTEPGVLLTRSVKLRSKPWQPFGQSAVQFDVLPHATAQLGNIKTGLAVGGTLRMGNAPETSFGPVYGTFAMPQQSVERLSWSVFFGGEGRAVARDIFLDGNTFKDSADVRRKPLVLETRGGISLHVPTPRNWGVSGVRLDLVHVLRSREFAGQDKSDRYGSFQLSLNF